MNARNRYRSGKEVWLSAALFPLKLYTILALFALVCWHMTLTPSLSFWSPGFWSSGDNLDWAVLGWANSDFNLFTMFATGGYYIAAVILLWGGLWQLFITSRRAAIVSLVFAVAAFLIGVWLPNYSLSVAFDTL